MASSRAAAVRPTFPCNHLETGACDTVGGVSGLPTLCITLISARHRIHRYGYFPKNIFFTCVSIEYPNHILLLWWGGGLEGEWVCQLLALVRRQIRRAVLRRQVDLLILAL